MMFVLMCGNHLIFSMVLVRMEFQAVFISANNRNFLRPFKGAGCLIKGRRLSLLTSDESSLSFGGGFIFEVFFLAVNLFLDF